MSTSYITSKELINDQIWGEMSRKYGNDGKNNNFPDCPIYRNKKKGYSQNGEEGMLEYIFSKIGTTNKHCVEFGAGDGVTLSNTYHLHLSQGFKRTLIEANKDLEPRTKTNEPFIRSLITPENINDLIKGIPDDTYDLLSIDIDGDDYWVWKAMKKKARVVIVEYNCGIPNDKEVVIKEGKTCVRSFEFTWDKTTPHPTGSPVPTTGYYGANLKAFYRLAKSMGYEFVTSIVDNAIFVLKEDFPKLGIDPIDEETCMERYFNPHRHWGQLFRDVSDREWLVLNEK